MAAKFRSASFVAACLVAATALAACGTVKGDASSSSVNSDRNPPSASELKSSLLTRETAAKLIANDTFWATGGLWESAFMVQENRKGDDSDELGTCDSLVTQTPRFRLWAKAALIEYRDSTAMPWPGQTKVLVPTAMCLYRFTQKALDLPRTFDPQTNGDMYVEAASENGRAPSLIFHVRIAKPEFRKITGVIQEPSSLDARVEYTWGRRRSSMSDAWGYDPAKAPERPLVATFKRYDDGWRLVDVGIHMN